MIYIILGLKIAFNTIPTYTLIILGLCLVFFVWAIGWFYDKNNGWELHNQWTNERNLTFSPRSLYPKRMLGYR